MVVYKPRDIMDETPMNNVRNNSTTRLYQYDIGMIAKNMN